MKALANKIAVITGATRGIGAAIVEDLLIQGAIVIGTATTEEGANKISDRIQSLQGQGRGYVLNVADKNSITQFVETIKKDFDYPDILINNAGITKDNLILRMKDEEWNDVITTNLTGIFHLTKLCLRKMLKQHWGRIINLSSVVAVSGNAGQANYCAAKAGIIGLTKSLALELSSRAITVNAVAPGFIETDMTHDINEEARELLLKQIPLKRIGKATEIANVIGFLASDAASYITGQTIHVNGGMYLA